MNTNTTLTGRLKEQQRKKENSASLRVSELVPDRPLPEWILHRRKGAKSGHQSGELWQCRNPRDGIRNVFRSPSMIGRMGGPLDQNNMRKDWKSSSAKRSEALGRARISQNRRAEPIRRFPGGIRQGSVSSESPVAPFIQRMDLGIRQRFDYPDRRECTNARTSNTDRTTGAQGFYPKILTDKTFLTLDQSKLPLEVRSRHVPFTNILMVVYK